MLIGNTNIYARNKLFQMCKECGVPKILDSQRANEFSHNIEVVKQRVYWTFSK
jgi:hypothetical protein